MEHEDINWTKVIASMVPDDPMDTSPDLQGYFAARMLARLGRNLAIGGALWAAEARGKKAPFVEPYQDAEGWIQPAYPREEVGQAGHFRAEKGHSDISIIDDALGACIAHTKSTRQAKRILEALAATEVSEPYKADQWDTCNGSFYVVLGPGLVGLDAAFPANEEGWSQATLWAERLNRAWSREP
jgi:hypothetical protein